MSDIGGTAEEIYRTTNGMILNDAGEMVEYWYNELNNKFNDIKCHAMVVMPNHFHCIIENIGGNANISPSGSGSVGADPRVCPYSYPNPNPNADADGDGGEMGGDMGKGEGMGKGKGMGKGGHVGPPVRPNREPNREANREADREANREPNREAMNTPISEVVQWFKTMTTNHYIRGVKQEGWIPFAGKLWQRNYWEHIIRNDIEYDRITQYIINNPQKWVNDHFK